MRSSIHGPRILLLDLTDWACFASLAAAAKRRGMSIARVHRRKSAAGTAIFEAVFDRLVFGPGSPHLVLRHGDSADCLPQDLLDPPTVDVQGPEEIVDEVRRLRQWPIVAAARRVPDADAAVCLYDKLAMSELAADLGLRVPISWRRPDEGPLPRVVKQRVASGGQGVAIAHTTAELRRATDQLGPVEKIFFQEYVDGIVLNFGGVACDGRILAGAAYEPLPAADDPYGPAEKIRLIGDPQLERAVERLITSLGYTGFFCIDFIRGSTGEAMLIDFNPRVFGGWLAVEQSGVPLLNAYLSLFGLVAEPKPTSVPIGAIQTVRLQPAAWPRSWRDLWQQFIAAGRAVLDSAPHTGPRFAVATAIRAVLLLLRNAARMLRSQAQRPA